MGRWSDSVRKRSDGTDPPGSLESRRMLAKSFSSAFSGRSTYRFLQTCRARAAPRARQPPGQVASRGGAGRFCHGDPGSVLERARGGGCEGAGGGAGQHARHDVAVRRTLGTWGCPPPPLHVQSGHAATLTPYLSDTPRPSPRTYRTRRVPHPAGLRSAPWGPGAGAA